MTSPNASRRPPLHLAMELMCPDQTYVTPAEATRNVELAIASFIRGQFSIPVENRHSDDSAKALGTIT